MYRIARVHNVAASAAMNVQVDKTRQDVVLVIGSRINLDAFNVDDALAEANLTLDPARLGQYIAMK